VPPSGRAAFLDAYGPVGGDALLRARVLALMMGAVLALYARDEQETHLEAQAAAMIERALAG
jgi:NAD(P)H-hydrate repair Nnr-like enzyme with NAD(P)H-hydrate epimerase domain